MSTQLSKIVSAASISFALAFTFGCSSGDDSGGNEQPSNSYPNSSSSKAVVPSSSSKAVVQEYCVYKELCGVIEPIGSLISCSGIVGTKMDYCPYGYEKINLNLLNTCVKACSDWRHMGFSTCSKCGGQMDGDLCYGQGLRKFCNI